jgi:hypothetical protein
LYNQTDKPRKPGSTWVQDLNRVYWQRINFALVIANPAPGVFHPPLPGEAIPRPPRGLPRRQNTAARSDNSILVKALERQRTQLDASAVKL